MNVLRHVAIIMDGNGRWATRQSKDRSFGHKEGAKNVRTITKYASTMGIEFLTLYAFSTENWNRPKAEIAILMKLLSQFLKTEVDMLLENNIKFDVIGDMSRFSKSLQKEIDALKVKTAHCTGMTQVIAINYGGQDEIIRAMNEAKKEYGHITQEILETYLDTAKMPPVDLLIRTGGEYRLSNFLLWQSAYAELFFTKTLWPDFAPDELEKIVDQFRFVERKFGGL